MKFAIRVDDLGWTHVPRRDEPNRKKRDIYFAAASEFHEAMGGFPYLGAVIPSETDDLALSWLKKAREGGLTVALHGWDHSMREGARNEFEGLSMPTIRELLDRGQKLVGPTPHLVPPFNATVPQLAEACFHEGVKYIWGGPVKWATPPSPVELDKGVRLIPAWDRLYSATRWQQGEQPPILAQLAGNWWEKAPGLAVITLHLPWEFARDPRLLGVRELVSRVAEHLITPDAFAEACT